LYCSGVEVELFRGSGDVVQGLWWSCSGPEVEQFRDYGGAVQGLR